MKFLLLSLVLISCGPPCNVTIQRGGPTVDLAFFKATCAKAGCHLNDGRAVTQALASDQTFKAYQPALTRIVNKTMPPGAPLDDATIAKAKEYFQKGVNDGQGKDNASE
jgi:hypothetical protein